MNPNPSQLVAVLASGDTTRYHGDNAVIHQIVSAHSWGVAMIIALMHPNPSGSLMKEALLHDVGEKFAGDNPHPAKMAFPELRRASKVAEAYHRDALSVPVATLSDSDAEWLQFADMAECALYCLRLHSELGYPIAYELACTAIVALEKRHRGFNTITDELLDCIQQEMM